MSTLCPSCARPLSSGSVAGVCPACLLTGAQRYGSEDEAPGPPELVLRKVGGYDLMEKTGRGGMGVVYRAMQRSLGRTVAVKMIAAGELASPEGLRRFRQEAEAAAKLRHPGIVAIYEVGEHDGLPFFSMEFVPGGRTLAGLIAEKPMPPHAAAACLEKVARAVHHAHEHGILHRDLKPSNILLDAQGEPRVADFGLARQLGSDSSLTLSKNALGSPAYMPPEQAGGGAAEAGPASDVYALGAVLYHCLTGRPPFAGETVQTVLLRVREADPVPPRRLNASIPRDLDTLVLKCLEKSPARRYATAAALADDLVRFLQGEPVIARPLGPSGKLWRWTRRHPAAAALAAVLVLALAGGLGAALFVNRALAGGKKSVEDALTEKSTALQGQTRALVDALISRAEAAARTTGKAGLRTAAIDAIRRAAELPLSGDEKFRARNAAITALALPEASFQPQPHLPPGDWTMCLCDSALRTYIRGEFDGKISVHRVDGSTAPVTFNLAPKKIDCLLAMDRGGKLLAFRYDKTRLGILHVELGLMPFQAEPWPHPAHFRPSQVTFGKWPFNLRPLGLNIQREQTLVCWPEPGGSIVMADPVIGARLLTWEPPAGAVPEAGPVWTALQFSYDGKWLAAARGSHLEIRQMPRGPVHNARDFAFPVHTMRWVDWGGRLAVGHSNGSVRIVESFPSTQFPEAKLPEFEAHSRPVVNLDFGGGGLLTSSEDGTTRLWDRRSATAHFEFPAAAWHTDFAPGNLRAGPLLQAGMVGFVDFFISPVLTGGGNPIHLEATGPHCVMPSGKGIALLHDEGLEFIGTIKYGARNRVRMERVTCAAASPGSDWLLTGHGSTLNLLPIRWRGSQQENIVPGSPVELLANLQGVAGLALNGEATLLAMAEEHGNRVSVRPLGPEGKTLSPSIAEFSLPNANACALSPDGKWLAAGSPVPSGAALWELEEKQQLPALESARAAHNWHPVFSRDGRWLALSGRTCQLYTGGTWEPGPVLDLPPNGADHHGAAFYCPPGSPGRCLMAVVAADREVHLFRLTAGPPAAAEKLAILRLPGDPFVSHPAFDDSGNLTVALPRAQLDTWSLTKLFRELQNLRLQWPAASPSSESP